MKNETVNSLDFNQFFNDLSNDSPFLKIAIEGFAGTGKTFLATQIAIGLHKKIGADKPIVVYDTEKAFRAIKDLFDNEGIEVKQRKSRSLKDLVTTFQACESGYADILIIDSISHVWESFVQYYIEAKSKRLGKRVTKLSFPDWGYLKPEWKKQFSNWIVNANFHIILTGRAGYEYEHDADEETGKMTELRKSGIRMKAETETAYEPDILVLMERLEELMGKEKKITRLAIVLKDRYREIDGKTFENSTFKDFEPVVDKILSGSNVEQAEENPDTFDELNAKNENWQKKRDVLVEEVEAIFHALGFGQTKEDKQLKVNLLEAAFNTPSWTAIQNMKVGELESGVNGLKAFRTLYLNYIKTCADTSEKPDSMMAYEFIRQVWDVMF